MDTEARYEAMQRLSKQGLSYTEIGERFGLSKQRAYIILNPKRTPKEREAQLDHPCKYQMGLKNCEDGDCLTCGWNPAVRERRLRDRAIKNGTIREVMRIE